MICMRSTNVKKIRIAIDCEARRLQKKKEIDREQVKKMANDNALKQSKESNEK